MNHWKLNYIGEQLQKTTNKKYQLIISGLFLFDSELNAYQPRIEYHVKDYRIDLYFKDINFAIEVDEPYHLVNKEKDIAREADIASVIPGIKFRRIDISKSNWYEQFLKIKNEILKYEPSPWSESDIVNDFEKIVSHGHNEVGKQIISITKYLFGNKTLVTTSDNYTGIYVNEGNNAPGNYYIAIVCYGDDSLSNESKVSFVFYDNIVIENQKAFLLKRNWHFKKRGIDCLVKYFNINANYLEMNKELQFQKLKSFILGQFREINLLAPKLKHLEFWDIQN